MFRTLLRGVVLAQQADESFVDKTIDFLTGRDLVGTVGIVVGTAFVWVVLTRIGHKAVISAFMRRSEGLDQLAIDEGTQRVETLWLVIRRVLLITILVVAGLMLLSWWTIPIAPFLAVGSIVGFALGFGAQSFVKDVIAGFFIISENQFSIGDVVRIGGASGVVTDIRLRVTVLRDAEGIVHYVPNGAIDVASNLTQNEVNVVMDVGVGYSEQVDRVIEVLSDEVARFSADPEWAESFTEPPQVLGVQELADWSVNVRLNLTVTPVTKWKVRRELLRRVKNRLDAEGIEIPYPYTTIVPGGGDAWRDVVGTASEPT